MTMKTLFRTLAALACWVLSLSGVGAAEVSSLDSQGYIRDWLMLAPIPLPEGRMAGDLLLVDQIPNEATMKPKAGDEVTARGRKLTWQKVVASTNYVDFNAVLKSPNDHAAGYVATYVECDTDIPDVIMAVASNDEGRIYYNGIDIYAFTEARPLMLDADKGKVTLKKGLNVIVFKVINEQNSWQCAMRLMDKSGKPLAGVRIRTSP